MFHSSFFQRVSGKNRNQIKWKDQVFYGTKLMPALLAGFKTVVDGGSCDL
ncbi:conserved hypothetical protein [delta proteobacterium NaphS2]|nr:conserved hypothetical protein [delta proteobacterium NaphS2]